MTWIFHQLFLFSNFDKIFKIFAFLVLLINFEIFNGFKFFMIYVWLFYHLIYYVIDQRENSSCCGLTKIGSSTQSHMTPDHRWNLQIGGINNIMPLVHNWLVLSMDIILYYPILSEDKWNRTEHSPCYE